MDTKAAQTEPILFPPKVVAQRWNRHVMTIRRMIRCGQLPTVRVGCRRLISLDTIKGIESAGKPRCTGRQQKGSL